MSDDRERGAGRGDGDPSAGTVCPLCAVGCRLAPGAADRAEGRVGPANPGGRLCRKGVTAFEGVDGRLTEPRIREDGRLVAAGWERAYDRIVDGIETAVAAGGPDAVAFLGAPHSTNEANYLLGKLARTLGTNNVDNRARHCHDTTARVLADRLGWPASTNGLEDVTAADTILVVGANPAARQPVAFNSFVRPAVADGATLIHVDPVGNRTTRLADLHLAARPGADGLVLDLLCARVVADGAVERPFVETRTRGVEALLAGLDALDAGPADAGVDPAALDRAAGHVAGGRVTAIVGTGIEADDDEEPTAPDSLVNLLLLTGNVGQPGTGVHVFRGLSNEQGAVDAGCVPDRLPGHQPVTDPEARARIAAEWGVEPPAEPGIPATDLLGAFGETVRAAVVVGENPAVSKREAGWVADRLDALDHLTVVELADSETTARADVVLPAAAGVETAGTVTNLARRVQRLRPAVDPPAGVRADRRILQAVASRLSVVDADFAYDGPAAVFDELCRVAPTHDGLRYDHLAEGSYRWPGDAGVLYREEFRTPDGRAAFVPPATAGSASGSASGTDAGTAGESGGLSLVVGGRAGEGAVDGSLRVHPDDADRAGVGPGDPVAVTDDRRRVETIVDADRSVRPGTVFLHADVADPFVRAGTETVTIEPLDAE